MYRVIVDECTIVYWGVSKSFVNFSSNQKLLADRMKANEMGMAFGKYGENLRMNI